MFSTSDAIVVWPSGVLKGNNQKIWARTMRLLTTACMQVLHTNFIAVWIVRYTILLCSAMKTSIQNYCSEIYKRYLFYKIYSVMIHQCSFLQFYLKLLYMYIHKCRRCPIATSRVCGPCLQRATCIYVHVYLQCTTYINLSIWLCQGGWSGVGRQNTLLRRAVEAVYLHQLQATTILFTIWGKQCELEMLCITLLGS